MASTDTPAPAKAPRSLPGKIYDFLSGYALATVTLLILGLLTFFATLEQVDYGLYPTLNKYFSIEWNRVFILPMVKDKVVPIPLPGGYWMCALLLLNMTLGGVIRIRKGWKHVGNLISHFGIIFMLIGAGVTFHFSERGNMPISEGESSNTAEDYFEYVVEIADVTNGQAEKVFVIRGNQIDDLDSSKRIFRFPELPFDVELGGYRKNAVPVAITERAPDRQQEVFDGYFLMDKPKLPKAEEAERYTAGVYARVLAKDGTKSEPFILAGASFYPFTYRSGDRIFTFDMRKRLWPMPFTVQLDKFTAEFHPGTTRPAKFVSNVTRIENGAKAQEVIQMNEPMRYEGLTFFQASYGPPGATPGQAMYSVFEVVRNPADKWPEYSLWIVTFGMLVTFVTKLVSFIMGGSFKKTNG